MIFPTLTYEEELWSKGFQFVCGIDEVGRGCFAGPVVAGAVVFPANTILPAGIADSKLLKPSQREMLDEQIKQIAVCWAVGEISVEIINQVGIGKATHLAYKEAISKLSSQPDFFVIDAFYMEHCDRKIQKPIVKGDQVSVSIAAASIVAKVYRDALMTKLDPEYPQYGFSKHKGYGTKQHRAALKEYGLSKLHRTSFDLQRFL